jgi:Type ISP C-terminal specificity domain
MLALLSARSYTTTFAHDLEDDFPHVPFPALHADFAEAARIGSRIRALEGYISLPEARYRLARLDGDGLGKVLEVPTPRNAWTGDDGMGAVALTPDQALRMTNVSEAVWKFAVSGYPLLYKWLKARAGEPLHGERGAELLEEALDVAWRIEELLALFTEADAVLARVVDNSLSRSELNLPPRDGIAALEEDDDAV